MIWAWRSCETCDGSGLVAIGWEDGVAEKAECASCDGEGRYWAGRFPSRPQALFSQAVFSQAGLIAALDDPYKMDDPFADCGDLRIGGEAGA